MFTGIIEALGEVVDVKREGANIHFGIRSAISEELKVDQSLAHDGVCLTVVAVDGDVHTVTAIDETLQRTALSSWKPGRQVNLERAMRLGDRLDGHLVQGHVDEVGTCIAIEQENGSWRFTFSFEPRYANLLVDKGSICINGVSLTVIQARKSEFQVAIIPYTYQHTNFGQLQPADKVNLEFDILGKYLLRQQEWRQFSK